MEYVPKHLYDELLIENAQLKKRIAEQEQRIAELIPVRIITGLDSIAVYNTVCYSSTYQTL